jgi:hypothetical protein
MVTTQVPVPDRAAVPDRTPERELLGFLLTTFLVSWGLGLGATLLIAPDAFVLGVLGPAVAALWATRRILVHHAPRVRGLRGRAPLGELRRLARSHHADCTYPGFGRGRCRAARGPGPRHRAASAYRAGGRRERGHPGRLPAFDDAPCEEIHGGTRRRGLPLERGIPWSSRPRRDMPRVVQSSCGFIAT